MPEKRKLGEKIKRTTRKLVVKGRKALRDAFTEPPKEVPEYYPLYPVHRNEPMFFGIYHVKGTREKDGAVTGEHKFELAFGKEGDFLKDGKMLHFPIKKLVGASQAPKLFAGTYTLDPKTKKRNIAEIIFRQEGDIIHYDGKGVRAVQNHPIPEGLNAFVELVALHHLKETAGAKKVSTSNEEQEAATQTMHQAIRERTAVLAAFKRAQSQKSD